MHSLIPLGRRSRLGFSLRFHPLSSCRLRRPAPAALDSSAQAQATPPAQAPPAAAQAPAALAPRAAHAAAAGRPKARRARRARRGGPQGASEQIPPH